MSVAEIIQELPRLTPEERSAVRRRLCELENADSESFLHEAADIMFQEMDKEETRNARRKSR
jgi:hypothetical protein